MLRKKVNNMIRPDGISTIFVSQKNGDDRSTGFLKENTLENGPLKTIERALEKVKEIFDYVLIDCGPSLSLTTINGLIASDYVLIPAETKISSNYSLSTFISTVNTIKEVMNNDIEILGVIATMYYCQAKEDKSV